MKEKEKKEEKADDVLEATAKWTLYGEREFTCARSARRCVTRAGRGGHEK